MSNIKTIEGHAQMSDVLDNYRLSTEVTDIREADVYKPKPVYEATKRVFDITASLFALIVLSPLLLIVAIAIVIDDNKAGPIFSQTRCGKNGKEFKIYKFRTMCHNAEEQLESLRGNNQMDGPVFKIEHDPRITRIGKFLRKSSIDELPQLVNILKGDMSIVGPRPALPNEVAQYSDKDKTRLSVLPGLTCYWQIQPDRNNVTFDEWMKLDREYISDRNAVVDVKIILRTVLAVLKLQGC